MFKMPLISTVVVCATFAMGGCEKGPKSESEAQPAKTEAKVVDDAPTPEKVASPQVSVDVEGKTYGAGVSESEVVSISSIAADPEAYDGKTVRVEGMVTDVCAKRGCWFTMAGDKPGEKARFKVTDGEMVFPMSAKGDYAVAEGKVVAQKLSLEDTRAMEKHYAEESGVDFDPESISEGKTVFRIQGTGAVIGTKK